jgi:hypothetical protein
MTTRLQRVMLADKAIWIEVADSAVTDSRYQATTAKEPADKAAEWARSVDLAPTLSGVVEPVREALKGLAPGEVTIEFSVGFKGEVGFFLAKGETNGTLKITAKWSDLKR